MIIKVKHFIQNFLYGENRKDLGQAGNEDNAKGKKNERRGRKKEIRTQPGRKPWGASGKFATHRKVAI
jgi:hypothetical protein